MPGGRYNKFLFLLHQGKRLVRRRKMADAFGNADNGAEQELLKTKQLHQYDKGRSLMNETAPLGLFIKLFGALDMGI